MLAKKCDRCGELYVHYCGKDSFCDGEKSNGLILVDLTTDSKTYYSHKRYDLCPECMLSLEEFLHEKLCN